MLHSVEKKIFPWHRLPDRTCTLLRYRLSSEIVSDHWGSTLNCTFWLPVSWSTCSNRAAAFLNVTCAWEDWSMLKNLFDLLNDRYIHHYNRVAQHTLSQPPHMSDTQRTWPNCRVAFWLQCFNVVNTSHRTHWAAHIVKYLLAAPWNTCIGERVASVGFRLAL